MKKVGVVLVIIVAMISLGMNYYQMKLINGHKVLLRYNVSTLVYSLNDDLMSVNRKLEDELIVEELDELNLIFKSNMELARKYELRDYYLLFNELYNLTDDWNTENSDDIENIREDLYEITNDFAINELNYDGRQMASYPNDMQIYNKYDLEMKPKYFMDSNFD